MFSHNASRLVAALNVLVAILGNSVRYDGELVDFLCMKFHGFQGKLEEERPNAESFNVNVDIQAPVAVGLVSFDMKKFDRHRRKGYGSQRFLHTLLICFEQYLRCQDLLYRTMFQVSCVQL